MLKTDEILVSVIIPAYNAKNTISRCLKSIINQSYKNLEIIVINDGSIDNTLEILNSISDNRLKIVSQKNSGVSSARNKGLDIASGEFIAFVDSDDFIDENFIFYMLENAVKNKNDIIVCNVRQIINDKTIIFKDINAKIGKINPKEYLKLLMLNENTKGWVCNKFFKKNILKDIKFEKKLICAEDKLFLIQAILNSKNIYKIDKSFYNYDIEYKKFSPLHYQNGLDIDKITKKIFIKNNLYDEFKNEIFFMKISNYMFLVVNKDEFKKDKYLYELQGLLLDIKSIVNSPYFSNVNFKFRIILNPIYFLKNKFLVYCFLSILNSKISKRILKKLL